jgi:hypothetical protein
MLSERDHPENLLEKLSEQALCLKDKAKEKALYGVLEL